MLHCRTKMEGKLAEYRGHTHHPPSIATEIAAVSGLSQREIARCVSVIKSEIDDLRANTSDISSYMV